MLYYALSKDFTLTIERDSSWKISLPYSRLLLLLRSARFDWALTRRLMRTRDSRGSPLDGGRRPPRPYFSLFSCRFAVDDPARLRYASSTTSQRSSHGAVPPSLEQSKDMGTRKSRDVNDTRARTQLSMWTYIHYI